MFYFVNTVTLHNLKNYHQKIINVEKEKKKPAHRNVCKNNSDTYTRSGNGVRLVNSETHAGGQRESQFNQLSRLYLHLHSRELGKIRRAGN